MLGVVDLHSAIGKAQSFGLDLVEISPNAEPPVCKIMDYGKYKYELKKKLNDAKKKQKIVEIKEIKLRPTIGEHDLQIKIKQIKKFIEEGEKVKITLRFKGREITHNEIGLNLVNKVIDELQDIAKAESPAKLEGKQILVMLVGR
jgi:translation initiation factor IF-3